MNALGSVLVIIAAAAVLVACDESDTELMEELAAVQPEGLAAPVADHLAEMRDRVRGTQSRSEAAAAWLSLAQTYHAYGFHAIAADAYSQAIKRGASQPQWQYLQALAHLAEGSEAVAISSLLDLVDDRGASTELKAVAHRTLAEIQRRRGEPQEAYDHALLSTQLNSDDPGGWLLLARAQRERGDPSAALASYANVLRRAPHANAVFRELARLRRELGDSDGADRLVARAGDREAPRVDPWLARIESLRRGLKAELARGLRAFQQARYVDAGEAYARALRFDPNDESALLGLAAAQLKQGNAAEAEAAMTTLLAKHPEHTKALLNLASARVLLSDYPSAIAALQEALRIDPDYRLARLQIGKTLCRAGRVEEGVAELETLVRSGRDAARLGTLIEECRAVKP